MVKNVKTVASRSTEPDFKVSSDDKLIDAPPNLKKMQEVWRVLRTRKLSNPLSTVHNGPRQTDNRDDKNARL